MAQAIDQQTMDRVDAFKTVIAEIVLRGITGATPGSTPNNGGTSTFDTRGFYAIINDALDAAGSPTLNSVPDATLDQWASIAMAIFSLPVRLPSYTVASLPNAAANVGSLIYVSNASGGSIPAFSDGTNWRRVDNRNVVS